MRSSLHPFVFSVGYWVVENAFGPRFLAPQLKTFVLVSMPKVVQAGFAALGDWYTWRLAENLYGHGTATAWTVVSTPLPRPVHESGI